MAHDFDDIVVELAKLRDYCLSHTHPRGRHKARVFRATFGITSADADWLREMLLGAVQNHDNELLPTEADNYGQRYVLDFAMSTASGTGTVRSTWIVLANQNVLRLTSCYVL